MFTKADFDIFKTEMTLEARMYAIKNIIDPKFEAFAQQALPILNEDGQTWTAHVAKHLRRTVYPPDNTWVAFAPNKRGYKMMPHFELGIWEDNVYLWLAVLENMKPNAELVQRLADLTSDYAALPGHFVLSADHMVNVVQPLAQAPALIERYGQVKKSEVIVGLRIADVDVDETMSAQLLTALRELLPLYEKLRS